MEDFEKSLVAVYLREWGLSDETIKNFCDNEITVDLLADIEDTDLKELVPHVKERILFRVGVKKLDKITHETASESTSSAPASPTCSSGSSFVEKIYADPKQISNWIYKLVTMTPTPQEHTRTYGQIPPQDDGNRIVISGMSGLYPQSNNVKEFSEILYNKVNPVTQKDLRFKNNHPEVARHAGSVPALNYFDAQFFKVHFHLAYSMDPMGKKILEQAYQAIYDAGMNPEELSGKKVGVYIGSCFSEAEKACFYEAASRSGFGIAACSKTMFANRISYWLNAKGPSMSIDEACCSSTAALEQAYLALSRGECEAAIVGGTYLCLHPQSSVHYGRIIKLCNDGKTKSFDERADGCARSEAINVLFLQKAKDAVRIYAEVLRVQTGFTHLLKGETGPKYGFYRDLRSTTNFIEKFYQDARVPPQAIEYVEAFGCGLPEVDKVELLAIEEVFCKNRDDQLLVGSVMSNIGYGEAASGISAITKVLLGYHNGQLAANLHCEQPRRDIAALRDGRMRVVSEHQQFDRTYVAVNGMSVTGVNSHVLLHGSYKPKNINRYTSSIPYLVTLSGRHEEAVKHMLEVLKSNPIDPEQLALLHNIHRKSISGHLGRGFIILRTDEEKKTVSLHEKADYFDNARRPLWFVYSGMGSQWAGMGRQLMRIPIFAAAIERCGQALEPKGLDIVNIITSNDETMFNNILNSFVGIAAIQIGLTDILHELGLKPDGIIGHSQGEVGCAYADGCLTAEETILSAYYRGLVSVETKFIHGSMAAIGMGYEEVKHLCPPEIEVACHNGPQSSTICGPFDVMREFVAELTAKGIFAKEVQCSNIAYHSRYIADAGPELLKYLQGAIRTPKARSERWLSTSVPEKRWNEHIAKFCSAEYLTNNLLNSVLFEETSQLVPNDAVLVEIAPHGLLQAILKRSMPANCKNISLTRRNHPDNAVLLLEAIGKLFMEGYYCDVQVLYPKVQMPVSTGTPFLSHFVKWAHDERWPMPVYRSASRKVAANSNLTLALQDKEHSYLRGHSIRGNTVYPFAASLTAVWDVLAMFLNVPKKQLSVEFNNIKLYSEPILYDRSQLHISVTIQRGTGYFEVLNEGSKVATGCISSKQGQIVKSKIENDLNKNMSFSADDVYRVLRDRDYFYSAEFQSIARVDEVFEDAELVWRDNWVTFIDSMLQLNVLRQTHNAVSQPISIRQIKINVKAHSEAILMSNTSDSKTLIKAKVSEKYDHTRSGGVTIENIKFQLLPPYDRCEMALKSRNFVPHFSTELDVSTSLEAYFQIVAENLNTNALTVVGAWNQSKEESMFKEINDVIKNVFGIKVNYRQITRERLLKYFKFENVDLILVPNLSTDKEVCQYLQEVLPRDKFVVSEEYVGLSASSNGSSIYRVLAVHTNDETKLQLIRWGPFKVLTATTTVSVRRESDLGFLASVRSNLTVGHRLLVITSYPMPSGLKELVSSWRKEAVRNKIHLVTINDSSNDDLEEKVREIDLAFNNITDGKLGGEYYLSVNHNTTGTLNMTLQGAQLGDYESLTWVNVPPVTGSGVTVNVHYAGININDLKQANGSLYFKKNVINSYGMDFSGVTESGKPVMGIVRSGAASTRVTAQPDLLWPVPKHWSLEDAATVPLAYVQAYYCLAVKFRLPRGRSILVHGGAGALGQAIISLALAIDCEVYTTVSDIRKKHFLLSIFPALKADHIGCSRDQTFSDMVEIVSKGTKCDIVISCVKGRLKDMSIDCNTFGGLFLDISQLQNGDEYNFGMSYLNKEKNYTTVDFSSLFEDDNVEDLKNIHRMVSEGIARGFVRPLSRVTYGPYEAARAFQLLASSSHRGRVLLHLKANTIHAQNRIRCNANRSQLVLCGRTSYGLQIADRLVARGAKQLHLHVPTQSSYLQHKIRSWQKLGVNVAVSSESLNNQKSVVSLLTSSLQLGPLEGVYIVAEETGPENNLISNMDTEIRKLCSDLSYFALIYFGDNSIGMEGRQAGIVCLNRLNDQLPATVLLLPEIKEEVYSSFINWRAAVDAAEQALQNTHCVILAHENKHKISLLQQIAKLAGLSIPDAVTKSLTLAELGIQNHKLQTLCTFLRVQYNLAFNEEQVRSLTIDTILEIEKIVLDLPFEEIKGLSYFFSYIDSDELLATTELVFLPTLISSASMRDDEFEVNQTNLCIIPGMEGHHERFRVFCERLKLPALVLQPGFDHPHETVVETAQRFAEVLLKKTGMNDSFYLLGYESGIVVALEIAAILEDHGLTGKVFCVGCAPEEFVNELEEQLSAFEDEVQLQDGVLRHMYSLITGGDCTALEHALENSTTWSEKLDVCTRTLLARVSHSAQYARSLIECALTRLNQKLHYSATPRPLRSQVILLRAALGHALPHTALKDISEQPFVVHQLNSPLAHIMTDLHCATIINDHLDPTILESFASRNTCDTYLVNADSFMSLE